MISQINSDVLQISINIWTQIEQPLIHFVISDRDQRVPGNVVAITNLMV